MKLRQRDPRRRDPSYLSWLHKGIPCIACLIEGRRPTVTGIWEKPGTALHFPIEAAHQKLAIAAHGWEIGGGGVRTHDDRCVPLCAWHHRLAPDSCDNGQRKFWDRLGLRDEVAVFCRELYEAFTEGHSGAAVVRHFAEAFGR